MTASITAGAALPAAQAGARPAASASLWLLAGATLAACTDAISGTALSITRISMMGAVHTTPDEFAWLDIAYNAAKLTAFLSAAWLSARAGLGRSLLAAVVALAAACVGCTLTDDLTLLVCCRALQGGAGGVLLVAAQGLLLLALPRRQQPIVQAIFALGAVMLPTTVTPALQGWIVDNHSWTWVFLAAAGVGLAAAGCVGLSLGFGLRAEPEAPTRRRPDGAGLAVLAGTALGLSYLLQQGSRWNWFDEAHIIAIAALSGAGLLIFCLWQLCRQGRNPLVDLSVFGKSNFLFGFTVSFVAGFALNGSAYLIPSFALTVLGFSATAAGLLLLPSGALVGTGLLAAGTLVQARGVAPFRLVPPGILLFMSAMWLLSGSTSGSGVPDLMPALLLRGLGLGLLFVTLTLITLLDLDRSQTAPGVGLFNAGKMLGGLIGIALLQTYLDHQAAWNRSVLAAGLVPGDPVLAERLSATARQLASGGLDPATAARAAIATLQRAIQTQVAALSFDEAFLAVALLFVAAAPVLIALKVLLSPRK